MSGIFRKKMEKTIASSCQLTGEAFSPPNLVTCNWQLITDHSRHKNGNNNNDVVITIALIASNIAISSNETDLSRPYNAFFESLIRTMSKGITKGKLRIAIRAPPFPDFDAIPDIIVKTEAKLILPNTTENM